MAGANEVCRSIFMSQADRQHLLAEQKFLSDQLAELPPNARLTRMSTEARLQEVLARLANIPEEEIAPARARLTFNGLPVVGSHGIFADFAMRAISSFTDAVASVAASFNAPLAAMGPIPNRGQNQLLITNTATGSFGFELEEYRGNELALVDHERPIAIALERTQALLRSTLGNNNDYELADVASETDPRALDKVRNFLEVLVSNNAVCALEYGGRAIRFKDVGQVSNSIARLGRDNLREKESELAGTFVGVLPKSRTFEFQLVGSDEIIRGKFGPAIRDVGTFNEHLYK